LNTNCSTFDESHEIKLLFGGEAALHAKKFSFTSFFSFGVMAANSTAWILSPSEFPSDRDPTYWREYDFNRIRAVLLYALGTITGAQPVPYTLFDNELETRLQFPRDPRTLASIDGEHEFLWTRQDFTTDPTPVDRDIQSADFAAIAQSLAQIWMGPSAHTVQTQVQVQWSAAECKIHVAADGNWHELTVTMDLNPLPSFHEQDALHLDKLDGSVLAFTSRSPVFNGRVSQGPAPVLNQQALLEFNAPRVSPRVWIQVGDRWSLLSP
jgi:hypothetical protein